MSSNGGKTWTDAKLKVEEVKEDESSRNFGWVRWEAELEADKGQTALLYCKATDSTGITQLEKAPRQRGYIYNGWSKVAVEISK